MKTWTLAISSIAILVALVAHMLLPGPVEQAAMLIRDRRYQEAIARLEQRIAAGDRRPALYALLARAYGATSEIERAVEATQKYIALRRDDPEPFAKLDRFYAALGKPDSMMEALERLVSLAPTSENVSRLAGLYRLYGRFDDELALLERLQGRADLNAYDLLRMGEILAAKHKTAAALTALDRAEAQLPADQERGRILLFELLVSAGRTQEAADRAKTWLTTWRRPWIAVRLVRSLARASSGQELDRLAEVAIRLHPEITFYLMKTMAEDGAKAASVRLLRNWLAKQSAPIGDDLLGFVAAARSTGDARLLWQSFAAVLAKPSAVKAQAFFAEVLADEFGEEAISPFRSKLSDAALASRPLFAARLSIREKNLALAQRFLRQTDLNSLSPRQRRAWVSLLAASSSDDIAFHILSGLRRRNALPPDLLPTYLRLAERLGHNEHRMLIISELARL